jgi:alpha-glucosidase
VKLHLENMTQRSFSIVIAVLAVATSFAPHSIAVASGDAPENAVSSPNGEVDFHLHVEREKPLQYDVAFGTHPVIERSRLGIVVDGRDLATAARIERVERYEINEKYPTRGVHSVALNHCNGAKYSIVNTDSGTRLTLEIRAFDDGVAFRHIVPGDGTRTPDAAIEFTIPAGSAVWHHDLRNHYEGVHKRDPIESISAGQWMAPPVTIQLPDGAGYAAITESALTNYPGMALHSIGKRTLRESLGHAHPVGYPFELRFGKEEAERLSRPAANKGEIVTPWRVIMVGKDLNALVNCDIVTNVSPPPDKDLFPAGLETTWIKPGRCVWKYLDGGDNSPRGMRDFSSWAGELGFEYNLLEGFWQKWSEEELRSFVEYSRGYQVGIWLWKDSRRLRTPEARSDFFQLCRRVGVVGVKIDFLDHEAREVIDLYETLLREAARHELMVDFHGANKPTGQARTWPNELTREAVRGMEGRTTDRAVHDATLPFTRYLAGPGDYTPVVFGSRRGDTTAAHQIATAAVFTSPLLVNGAHPQSLLDSPAVEMIKSIPSVWDETIVLPGSEIGTLAAFARRHGDDWFLAVLAGTNRQKPIVRLSFLGDGVYQAMLVGDTTELPASVAVKNREVTATDSLPIELAGGGGFIARFTRGRPPFKAVEVRQ